MILSISLGCLIKICAAKIVQGLAHPESTNNSALLLGQCNSVHFGTVIGGRTYGNVDSRLWVFIFSCHSSDTPSCSQALAAKYRLGVQRHRQSEYSTSVDSDQRARISAASLVLVAHANGCLSGSNPEDNALHSRRSFGDVLTEGDQP